MLQGQEIVIKIEDIIENKAEILLKIPHGTVIYVKNTNIALIPSYTKVMLSVCEAYELAFIIIKCNDPDYIYGKFTLNETYALILGYVIRGYAHKGDSDG